MAEGGTGDTTSKTTSMMSTVMGSLHRKQKIPTVATTKHQDRI